MPRKPSNRSLSYAALLLGAAFLLPALAHAAPAAAGGYSLQLEDEYGRALSTWYHRGDTYILGQYGTRYNVRVSNHTGQRIEAVVTVDGRDAISGDLGDYSRQRGYVIDPYGSVLVEGFRQSDANVAAFRFTSPGDSYSGRRGSAQHVGVVGVAVFKEKAYRRPVAVAPPPRPRPSPWNGGWLGDAREESRKSSADAPAEAEAAPSYDGMLGGLDADEAPAAGAARSRSYAPPRQQNNLGTRYGESTYSPVVEVPFQRARSSRPDQILSVYYDDARGLANRGIQVYGYAPPPPAPDPFPTRYAPPPPY